MPASSDDLSERELEILRLVATGASNKEIALQLSISANTVKVHLRNIFAKIGASSRTEAAMYAVNAGLVAGKGASATVAPLEEKTLLDDGEAPPVVSASVFEDAAIQPVREARRSRFIGFLAILILLAAAGWIAWRLANTSRLGLVAAYDESRWQSLAPLPAARAGLAVAAYEGGIFVFGGQGENGTSGATYRYDLKANSWTALASKPTPVRDAGSALIGGRFYLPGGLLAEGLPTAVLEIYDPSQDSWSQGAPVPVALSGYALAEYDGRLYLFGGWDGAQSLDTVFMYEPDQNEWLLQKPMPTRRAYAAAATTSGVIYVMGGYDGRNALDVNEIYNPGLEASADGPWSSGLQLPSGRYRMSAASIADILFIAGGLVPDGNARQGWQLLPQAESWEAFEMPVDETWIDLGLAPVGTRLFFLGGMLDGIFTDRQAGYQAIYTVALPVIR